MDYSERELLDKAKAAMQYAYAPYSKFKVGACVLMADGSFYTGCNIENSSYPAGNCAERTAIFKAISEGKKDFKAIAIVSIKGEKTLPCGICRQVMSEFFNADTKIILEDEKQIYTYKLEELLPESFKLKC